MPGRGLRVPQNGDGDNGGNGTDVGERKYTIEEDGDLIVGMAFSRRAAARAGCIWAARMGGWGRWVNEQMGGWAHGVHNGVT